MKIAFLCGSLEPGRDGVGDYVLRLAMELWRQGHSAVAIALNDQYSMHELTAAHSVAGGELLTLRLPANWPAVRRFTRAQEWVSAFIPDWISLQFVPYSFHPKGLPLSLSKHLSNLLLDRQVHLMMHESWTGAPGDGLKLQLLSVMQQACIRRLVHAMQPAVLHTHLPLYRQRMERLGWRTLPLPLFSNIPVEEHPLSLDSSIPFRVGIFSQVDTESTFLEFIASLAAQVRQQRPFQVLLIGGAASRMQRLQAILESIDSLRGNVHYTGFLAPTQLSTALQSCDLGITAVPRHALGKSGSVAAFLAHGIPVAAPIVRPSYSGDNIGFFSKDLCAAIMTAPTLGSFEAALAAARVAQPIIQISSIAQVFLADLIPR
jgi:glycosyltransferase involved in cell wall biosynthesis